MVDPAADTAAAMTKPFIYVTPDHGWIRNIYWVNSRRDPYMDLLWLRRSRMWGGCEISPAPNMYLHGQEVEDA